MLRCHFGARCAQKPLRAAQCQSGQHMEARDEPGRARLAALVTQIPLAPGGIPRCWISRKVTPVCFVWRLFPPFVGSALQMGFATQKESFPCPGIIPEAKACIPFHSQSRSYFCLCASSALSAPPGCWRCSGFATGGGQAQLNIPGIAFEKESLAQGSADGSRARVHV